MRKLLRVLDNLLDRILESVPCAGFDGGCAGFDGGGLFCFLSDFRTALSTTMASRTPNTIHTVDASKLILLRDLFQFYVNHQTRHDKPHDPISVSRDSEES